MNRRVRVIVYSFAGVPKEEKAKHFQVWLKGKIGNEQFFSLDTVPHIASTSTTTTYILVTES